jgi:hypothetical protein
MEYVKIYFTLMDPLRRYKEAVSKVKFHAKNAKYFAKDAKSIN